jgi:Ca-activated chloride channel family protein
MRVLVFLLALLPAPASACSVALVLAMDVSGSVSREEYALQMNGLADALGDPLVSEALVNARALVALIQWSGYSRQRVSIPWRSIHAADDVTALRAEVETMPRAFRNYATAIGEVLDDAVDLLVDAPRDCTRKVIDVSGDGATNEGKRPAHVHARLAMMGVTVNGLAIRGSEPNIVEHFREQVIYGPGAFVEIADGYADYPRAIRRKLIAELSQPVARNDPLSRPFWTR